MENPNVCSVCLRHANGYHYDVISCKGCKTFFRRMFLQKLKVECNLHNDCFHSSRKGNINLRCRSCRFQKCLNVGMNPKAFQNVNKDTVSHKPSTTKEINQFRIENYANQDNKWKDVVDSLSYLEITLEKFRTSAYNPRWEDLGSLEELIASTCKLNLADVYGPMSEWTVRKASQSLIKCSKSNLTNKSPTTAPKIWSLFNMLTTTEYIKCFSFFHKLSSNDQYILVRYVTLACLNLHVSYFATTLKFDTFRQPDGAEEPQKEQEKTCTNMLLQMYNLSENHYEMALMSISSLIRCRVHPIEYTLLKAICACNPVVPGLSLDAQKILSQSRLCFVNILLDYCLRNGTNGPGRFAEIIGIFSLLERQQKIQRDMYTSFVVPKLSTSWKTRLGFLHEIMSA